MSKRPGPGVVQSDAESDPSEAEPDSAAAGPSTLAEALELRRNLRIGLAVGLGLATVLYVPTLLAVDLHVVGPGGLYLGLGLVLAATVTGVVTAGLCAKTMLEPVLDRQAWLRRGGAAAVVGGAVWTASPALAWLAAAGLIPDWLRIVATSLAALALVVGTAGLHAAVRERAGRIERVAYWIVVVGLLLAAGNATGNPDPFVETPAGTLPSPFLTSAFLAGVAAIPFAATAELAGVLPARRIRALQVGALLSTLAVAWLVVAGGWVWTTGRFGAPAAVALAAVAIPAGLGWAIAGHGVRSLAMRRRAEPRSDHNGTDAPDS